MIKAHQSKFLIPLLVSLLIFTAGLLNIYSAFYTQHVFRMEILNDFLPLEIRYGSRTLIVLSGFFLLFLARGIFQKKYRAWLIALIILTSSLILHLFKGLDVEESIILLAPIALLVVFRAEFTIRSATTQLIQRVKISIGVLTLLLLYSTVGFFLLQGQFSRDVTWPNIYRDYEYTITGTGSDTLIPKTKRAEWFENSIGGVGWTAFLFVVAVLFGPRLLKNRPTEEDLATARGLVLEFGKHPTAYFSLMPDKQLFFNADKNCIIAYKISGGTALVLGDIMGPAEQTEACLKNFIKEMAGRGISVAFYQTSENYLNLYRNLGYKWLKIGEDAVIDLENFSLNGPAMKNVRNSAVSVQKKGVTFTWHPMDELPWKTLHKILSLRENWEKDKHGRVMTFSLGFFPFPPEPEARVLTAFDSSQNLLGVFSFFPFGGKLGMNLDLMIRSQSAPNGLVEACLAEAATFFKSEGKKMLSIGLATSFYTNTDQMKMTAAQKAVNFLYQNFNRFYPYQTLASFKEKFQPAWQPRFLVYKNEAELPKITLGLVRVHLPGENL